MGFTIYWDAVSVDHATFNKFVKRALNVIRKRQLIGLEHNAEMFQFDPKDRSGESFVLMRNPEGFQGCKTGRNEYTQEVWACLILAYEYGLVTNISSDDMGEGYLKTLEIVKGKYKLRKYNELVKFANDENIVGGTRKIVNKKRRGTRKN